MASTTASLRGLFARLSLTPAYRTTSVRATPLTNSCRNVPIAVAPATRGLHTTAAWSAKAPAGKGGGTKKKKKKKGAVEPDVRIVNLKSSMPRRVPAPLRFARNRFLRHWTIHRAWLLYQNKERIRRELEWERMYRSMHKACEELRTTRGPGTRPEGFLYRVAVQKIGIYGHNGIPIEYARAQTETPPRQAWNHEWTRT